MRFERLSEAVALVNQTGYGLTSGLESLDEREWAFWQDHLHAGNLYINRVTTGAVVLRQPFGGFGKSSFGPGLKAGGPNYVAQFMDFTDQQGAALAEANPAGTTSPPDLAAFCEAVRARGLPEANHIIAAVQSYQRAVREEFGQAHDHFKLVGQDNLRRYLPLRSVRVRVHRSDTAFELFARASAAFIAGCRATISLPPGLSMPAIAQLEELTESWGGAIEFVEETEDDLIQAMREGQTERLRYAAGSRVPLAVLQAAAQVEVSVITTPVSAEGRLELLWYVREQSLSIDYHRYGNLGPRAGEARALVL
jgi:RHH-type transcriptional regulator, proline utilization regulon repressor / proline dehydrogenase / delta 1-pyrroline-5-carboxylate dehydrogenase